MFVFVAFVIFSAALFTAAYYAWVVPQQHESELLISRLRERRAGGGVRTRSPPDLIKREQRGPLAAVGDFVTWVGALRRLHSFHRDLLCRRRIAQAPAFARGDRGSDRRSADSIHLWKRAKRFKNWKSNCPTPSICSIVR
jgi:hypothetical protein